MTRPSWMNCVLTAGALTAMTAPFAAPGEAKVRAPVVTALKKPAAWQTLIAESISSGGRVGGWGRLATDAESVSRAVAWPKAKADPVELARLPDSTFVSSAIGINDRGQIAGRTDGRAVLWDKRGAISADLHARLSTDFKWSEANAVNARGEAAGRAILAANSVNRAVFWPKRGAAVVLPIDASVYQSTLAYDVNNRRVVCGYAGLLPSGKPYHAVYWPKGGDMVDLAPKIKDAAPTGVGSVALQVMSDGVIVGVVWDPISGDVVVQRPWVYDPRVGSVQLIDAGGASLATVWGTAGDKTLLGYLDEDWLFQQNLGATRPAVWERHKAGRAVTWTLKATIEAPAGFLGLTPVDGNSRGKFVAVAKAADGSWGSFIVSK